jgi:hypothetical protein
MTLLVTQSHLCVQAGTPQCPAPLRALPPGSWRLQFGTQQERKYQRPLYFTLCTHHLTSPHLPGVGQCSNRSCNRCERLLCARRERVTEGALSKASHSALSHLSLPRSEPVHRPFFLERCKKGSDDLSVFVRVDCVCCEYIKVRARGLSPSSLLIHEQYMMMREVGMSSQQAIAHNDARSSVACSVAFLSSSEPSSVFASAFVHHARAWSARPRLAQHLAA